MPTSLLYLLTHLKHKLNDFKQILPKMFPITWNLKHKMNKVSQLPYILNIKNFILKNELMESDFEDIYLCKDSYTCMFFLSLATT